MTDKSKAVEHYCKDFNFFLLGKKGSICKVCGEKL